MERLDVGSKNSRKIDRKTRKHAEVSCWVTWNNYEKQKLINYTTHIKNIDRLDVGLG